VNPTRRKLYDALLWAFVILNAAAVVGDIARGDYGFLLFLNLAAGGMCAYSALRPWEK
jgi:hypothetical protein